MSSFYSASVFFIVFMGSYNFQLMSWSDIITQSHHECRMKKEKKCESGRQEIDVIEEKRRRCEVKHYNFIQF